MKVLVTGVKGQLGYDIVKECEKRNIGAVGVDIDEMDITNPAQVEEVIKEAQVDAVIHCAAWTAVDRAEDEIEICRKVNKEGPANIAKVCEELDIPVCQDTGMAVVFLEIGQDVHIVDGSLEDAVNEGVKNGYIKGLLRKSVVKDPLDRVNTGDNTPAVIHTKIVDGDKIKITVAPKGFGSENMSGIKMLTPASNRNDVINTVIEFIKTAGANPCPPMVIGVGIGGDFEMCAYLAKKALCRET